MIREETAIATSRLDGSRSHNARLLSGRGIFDHRRRQRGRDGAEKRICEEQMKRRGEERQAADAPRGDVKKQRSIPLTKLITVV